jgi:protein-L-isoaspartate(D-aspartate) O-methyltransferase
MVNRRHIAVSVACAAALVSSASPVGCSSGERDYVRMRERMVLEQIVARGVRDARVVAAMKKVPRHLFVPPALRDMAYDDGPLPIGSGQTISQPYIVALMTASLGLKGGGRVLEIGTGSGYQAAVLAEIVDTVYTIEILPELARRAEALLDTLGYRNVRVRAGDGFYGWPTAAPFDGVIVTAAAPRLPEPLVAQLKVGGRLVIPIGDDWQELEVYEKKGDAMELVSTLPVRFVPMKGRIRDAK